jgi:hypothetical protein
VPHGCQGCALDAHPRAHPDFDPPQMRPRHRLTSALWLNPRSARARSRADAGRRAGGSRDRTPTACRRRAACPPLTRSSSRDCARPAATPTLMLVRGKPKCAIAEGGVRKNGRLPRIPDCTRTGSRPGRTRTSLLVSYFAAAGVHLGVHRGENSTATDGGGALFASATRLTIRGVFREIPCAAPETIQSRARVCGNVP